MKNIDLVILAGGKGTRIKQFLQNKPKPMLKFNNIFFLQYLVNYLSRYSFKKIYILTGYKNRIIFSNFHNKVFNLTKIICLNEKKAMGTGGALLSLKKFKMNNFILVNGDTIFDIDINSLVKSFKINKLGCMALTSKKKNSASTKLNSLELKKNIVYYKKKSNLINGGTYFFNKKILNKLPKNFSSLENDVLPNLIKKKLITGNYYEDFFLDIGTPKYLKSSEKKLIKYFKRPAAFLDRDGVINYDYGYVHKMKDFHFKKGVVSGLRHLIKKNYFIFIITNQAGIAKGKFTENDFLTLQINLKKKLLKKNITFDDVQYCPYHPNGKIYKYRKKSNLRKPDNKMIINIFDKFLIDKKNSFMIGDKVTDEHCAKKSKLNFFYAENNFSNQVNNIIKKFNNY